MIQEIAPHRFDNTFGIKRPRPRDIILHYEADLVLLKRDNGVLRLPVLSELIEAQMPAIGEKSEYLFAVDGKRFFLMNGLLTSLPPGFEKHSTSIFREMQPGHMAFAGITGSQLYRWRNDNRYCGRCGGIMQQGSKERVLECTCCNHKVYPKISPAVIVALTHEDRLLMVKYARGNFRRFALVAGFVEIGETFEDAVRREVMEEVGLCTKNIRYYGSQPWAFSDSQMIGFFAELDGDPTVKLEQSELSESCWFSRHEIPEPLSSISIGAHMIRAFKHNRHVSEMQDSGAG